MNFNQKEDDFLKNKLKNKFSENKERGKKLVLMIAVDDGLVNLALFTVGSQKVSLDACSSALEWDGKDEFSLIANLEKAWPSLSLPKGISNLAVIFLISPFWAGGDDSISESKKPFLTAVCRRFNLDPLGFLFADESLIYYFKKDQGGLPSFISIFLGSSEMAISLVHLGKTKSRLRWKRDFSKSIFSQTEEILEKIDFQGVMPPNLIFWGGLEKWPDEIMNEANDYQWVGKKDSLFLHFPQITFLDWPDIFNYFCPIIEKRFFSQSEADYSGGRELGSGKQPLAAFPETDFSPEEKPTIEKKAEKKTDLGPIGQRLEEEASLPLPEGFFYGEIPEKSLPKQPSSRSVLAKKADRDSGQTGNRFSLAAIAGNLFFLKKAKNFFRVKRKWWLWASSLFFGLLALGLVFGIYFAKAKIIIFVTPQIVNESRPVTIKTGLSGFDADKGFFPAVKVEIEKEVANQVEVNGEKMVGEKAVGTVTVFNRTGREKKFSSGTVIKDGSGREFLLNDSITVASKSADFNSGTEKMGEADSGVTAVKIGADYNLDKGTIFSIKGFSQDDFVARAKNDFSGGTNRKVKAVSADDISRLKRLLESEAVKEGKKELDKKKPPGLKIVSADISEKLVDFSPQRRENEEAEILKGTAKVKLSILAVDENDFKKFSSLVIDKKTEHGLGIKKDSVDFNLKINSESPEEIKATVDVKGKLYPEIDKPGLAKKLAGVKRSAVNRIIRRYPRIYRSQAELFLPFWPWLPASPEKIILEIRES